MARAASLSTPLTGARAGNVNYLGAARSRRKFELFYPDGFQDETYLIAEHAEERAPGARTVTIGSPFGSALVGTAVGDEVAYDAPGGTFRYRIVAFEPFAG